MLKFIAGLAAGYAVGLLIAPASGEETRQRLMEQARELPDRAREVADKARDLAQAPQRKANEFLNELPNKAADVAAETARKATEQAVGRVREKTGLQDNTGTNG